MAKMYPPEVRAGTTSAAEKHIFGRLKEGLSGEWLVLHSLGLAGHERKPWAEIDFVLVGPPGVYCLEVKGGRIARMDGKWLFTDKDDQVTSKAEGPFAQVGSAAAALAAHLFAKAPWMHQSIIGYGVVTPNIRFTVDGPDIELGVVYDSRDGNRPIKDYVSRLSKYWWDRKGDRGTRELTPNERRALLEIMRGDFDLRPSLRERVGLVNDELLQLTTAQYHVLDGLAENRRVLIRGGAGSGKTLLAVEEARRAAAGGERVFLCCFNRHLAAFLQKALADVPAITVTGLHTFMKTIVDEASMSHRIRDAQDADVFNLFLPEIAVDALIQLERAESYDVLVVDEAQDLLRDKFLDFFEMLLKGGLSQGIWRFFLDPQQNIFDAIAGPSMQRLLSMGPAVYRLQVNCRNTAPIAAATALLSGVICAETRVVAGPEVEQIWYSNSAEARRLICRRLNALLSEGFKPEDIVIMSRRIRDHGCLRDGLDGVAYDLASLADPPSGQQQRATITFTTVSAYKGLESDVVLLIDVDELENEESLSSLYVGTSRARALLVIFLAESVRREYELRAREYGERLAASGGPG